MDKRCAGDAPPPPPPVVQNHEAATMVGGHAVHLGQLGNHGQLGHRGQYGHGHGQYGHHREHMVTMVGGRRQDSPALPPAM